MKDKIVALLNQLKSRVPLARVQALLGNFAKGFLRKVGVPFLVLFVVLIGAGIGGAYWVLSQPLDPLRILISEKIRSDFGAGAVDIQSIHWDPRPKTFRLGIALDGVEVSNLGHVHKFKTPRVELSVKFLKLLKGSLPLDVKISQGEIQWGPSTSSASTTLGARPVGDTKNQVLNFVLGRLSGVSLEYSNVDFEMIAETFSQNSGEAYFLFEKLSGRLNMGLLRGPYDWAVEGDANISVQKKLRVQGPFEIKSRGVSQSTEGKTVGFKVEDMAIDLSKLEMRALGFLSKPAGKKLELTTNGEVIFTPEGTFDSIEFKTGAVHYDPLDIGFKGLVSAGGKSISLDWGYGPVPVEKLELPIRSVESVAMNGNFETTGQLKWKVPNPIELVWKINFNNFSIDLEKLHGQVDPDSKGSVHLSFVSEGSLTEGHVRSPRTELQIQGTDAEIVLAKRNFVKPAGDPFSLIAKVSCDLDDYSLDLFSLNANNMQFEAKGNLVTRMPQKIKMDFRTNTIDLSRWSSYVPWFRKIPLQGSIETNGSFEGPISLGESDYSQVRWRVDRLNVARARGAFDRESFLAMGYQPQDLSMNGPFSFDFNFQGRGVGARVSRAQVQAAFDFSDVALILRSRFKKSPGVSLSANIQADQFDNRLNLKLGRVQFNDLLVDFSGAVFQGSQAMSIPLRTSKPIDLASWREFFVNLDPRVPLGGVVGFDGRLQFPRAKTMEEALDWNRFGFTGRLDLKNISGVWPPFQNTLKNLSGSLQVSSAGLQTKSMTALFGGKNVALQLDAKPIDASASNRLSLLWGWGGPWHVVTKVQAPTLKVSDFQVTASPSNPSFGEWLRKSLDPAFSSLSKFEFDVSADALIVEQDLVAQKFVGHFESTQEGLKLEPLKMNIGPGGFVEGSMLLDTRATRARKDPPQLVMGLKLRDVPGRWVTARALWPGWTDTKVSGELNLSSAGYDVDELREGLKGRFFGRVFGVQDAHLTAQVQTQMKSLFQEALGSTFLASESDFAKCLSDLSNTEVDLQIAKKTTEVAALDWVFKGGSKISATGIVNLDQGAKIEGRLWPGPQCVMGGLRDCYESLRVGGSKVSLAGHPADLKISIDDATLGSELIECRLQKAQASAELRAQNPEGAQTDRKKVQKSLQGKSSTQDAN